MYHTCYRCKKINLLSKTWMFVAKCCVTIFFVSIFFGVNVFKNHKKRWTNIRYGLVIYSHWKSALSSTALTTTAQYLSFTQWVIPSPPSLLFSHCTLSPYRDFILFPSVQCTWLRSCKMHWEHRKDHIFPTSYCKPPTLTFYPSLLDQPKAVQCAGSSIVRSLNATKLHTMQLLLLLPL